ncbi:uncharacterized protein isoform X1 [Leptinotarsa decemlineata]|uniref:uncharacterized protein isoform X1 n=2 Tax=Leptinotarsa decemlineata TaxID=7539 RepID=UPI000C252C94|nr:protein artichoke-like [Leptinotarsa decemlineata]
MDYCAVFLTFFLWKVTISCSTSTTETANTVDINASEELPQHIIKMGVGLEKIPQGSYHVRSINFGYNRIRELPSAIFFTMGYKSLRRIELCQNKISMINQRAFRELRHLKIIDLSGNNISGIEIGTFKCNPRLEKLDLSLNKIGFHPDKPFLNSPSLETLILTDNKIEQIYELTFYKLPKLRNLMMDNNIIFSIEAKSFVPLVHLHYLSLAHTGVYRLSETMFKNETYPRIIDVTDTPLSNKFYPPLKKVRNEGVAELINIDSYF